MKERKVSGKLLKRLAFAQIRQEDDLSEQQYREIAELIFETDEYIYPALFGDGESGKRNAAVIIPPVFEANCDPMFSKDNLFIAKIDGSVVGLILWYKGMLNWTPDQILDYANRNNVILNDTDVEKVRKEYVSERYSRDDTQDDEVVSIINVCVDTKYRGLGIANRMLQLFIEDHHRDPMELAVLADNQPAVFVYKKHGFRISEEIDGFSRYPDKPRCYIMTRPSIR